MAIPARSGTDADAGALRDANTPEVHNASVNSLRQPDRFERR